jgi:hypothetical protein|tara:strand:+ start:563 stop:739 length:177 start_codon:yes stop_codon:yes gene_type:complete
MRSLTNYVIPVSHSRDIPPGREVDSSKTLSDQKRPEFSQQQQKDYQKEISKTAFQSKK